MVQRHAAKTDAKGNFDKQHIDRTGRWV